MSEAVYGLARVQNDGGPLRKSQTTAFGTAGINVSAKQGRIYKVRAVNSNATTAYYVQLFDKATAPVNTDVPIWEFALAAKAATTASGDAVEDFGLFGLYVASGIGIAISTTKGVLTLAAATDATAYLLYTVQS